MLKHLLLISCILLSLQLVSAATLKGSVYDLDFNLVENVIIEIDTTPQQAIVSTKGDYQLEVPQGTYNLKATYFVDGILESTAEEKVIVTKEGTYSLDLILFPTFEEEEEITKEEEVDLGLEEDIFQPEVTIPWVIIAIIVMSALVYIIRKKKSPKKTQEQPIIANDLEKVIAVLKRKDNRATQKEIRKELNLSEAKVSLMIADLESQGKIRKIKQGRGNIIVLETKKKE